MKMPVTPLLIVIHLYHTHMDKKALKLLHTGNATALDQYLTDLSREEKYELLNTILVHGDSIAHFAAREHKLEILKVLAQHHCNFEISNDNGMLLQDLSLSESQN